MEEATVISMLELGLDGLNGLPTSRRRALLIIAMAVVAAEERGERELARELCGVIIREARLVVAAREAAGG